MVSALFKVALVVIAAWITVWFLSRDELEYTDLLQGKNVLVTGASSGIGEETAYYYAKLGANVVIAARREELLQKVLHKCQQLSPKGKFKYIVADFAINEVAKQVVEEAVTFLGSLDILLLNHAYLLTSTNDVAPWTGSEEQYNKLQYSLDVNFLSYARAADAAIPHLKKTNGSICVISSMIILRPQFTLPYATSKSAMSIFFTGLRQEFHHRGVDISVTIVHLGFIHTDSGRASLKSMSANNMEEIELQAQLLPETSQAKCAEDLVQAFARRETEVYYPYNQMLWFARILSILSKDADLLDSFGREVFTFISNVKKMLFLM